MVELEFAEHKIELFDESSYTPNSADNIFTYENVFADEESDIFHSTRHGIKVYKNGAIFSNALICAVGGATGIHKNSAVIINENILMCCADMIFSLSLPDLKLNWMKKVDDATCFQIFDTENGIFVHGELQVSRIDEKGNIIWSASFADILVTLDSRDNFILHKDFIEIVDWNHSKYKLNFNGEFI